MIIYYFGADEPWNCQSAKDINRRNMAILLAIAESEKVKKVYNIVRCTRALIFNKRLQIKSKHPKIINLYIAPIFPERGILKGITRYLNQFVFRQKYRYKYEQNIKQFSWCYWPQGYLDYKLFGLKNEMIFDSDHNIIDDPNIEESNKKKQKQVLLRSAKEAKFILSSSRSMLEWYNERGFTKTYLMLNGVFQVRQNISLNKVNKDLTVTYCGTLSKWVESEWLISLVKDHPHWRVNIIGKNFKTDLFAQLEAFNNVVMHGFLKPNQVDTLIKQSDVCIGLYRVHPALDVNSMKLYDYLVQGKPVVVNNYHDFLEEDFKSLIKVASDYTSFKNYIDNPTTPEPTRLQAFLKNATWHNRVTDVLKLINDK